MASDFYHAQPPTRLAGPAPGRRRTLGNRLGAVCVGTSVIVVVGVFLPWVDAYAGGDSPHLLVNGIADGNLGLLAVTAAAGLALGGLFAAMFSHPVRTGLPAVPAACGLVLWVVAASSPAPLDNGGMMTGTVAWGLVVEGAAFASALLASLVCSLLDLSLGRR